jgi:hypothetical protein
MRQGARIDACPEMPDRAVPKPPQTAREHEIKSLRSRYDDARQKFAKVNRDCNGQLLQVFFFYLFVLAGVGIGVWQLVELGIRESEDYQRCRASTAAEAAAAEASDEDSAAANCIETHLAIQIATVLGFLFGLPCCFGLACVCLSVPGRRR